MIWVLIILVSVIILILTLLTSVNSLHKKFIQKTIEKKERSED